MYEDYFRFTQKPFSIAPDPGFLFLSDGHREALAHLMYGLNDGGFVLVTGEVGTGKTTLLRNLVGKVPESLDVAFILNPRLTVRELLETICEELGIIDEGHNLQSVKQYIDVLNVHLLKTHAEDRSTVLIIDEAQNLSPAVLEQIRLLTNLETNEKKLLRILLLGQPELAELLARKELRQLAQRITARYHLSALNRGETHAYVAHRLTRASGNPHLFTRPAISTLFRASRGIPRVINVVADRALLGAYVDGKLRVNAKTVRRAARESAGKKGSKMTMWLVAALLIVSVGAAAWFFGGQPGTADIIAAMPTLPLNKSATDLEQISAAQPAQTQSVKEPSIEEAETEAVLTQQEVAQAPVQPSTPEPETKVYDQVTRPKNQTQVHTEQQAFSELYSAWGAVYTAPNMITPCDYAKMVSLQCLNRKGTWSDVEQLDLPVVLELWDTENRPFYAALLGSKGDELTLVVSETTLITTARHLRNLWFGSYVALWHVPTKNRKELKLGDTDPSVVWLRSSLSKEFGRSFTSENEEVYDETVRDAILQFQQSLGLNTDGIVGPETWVELQNRHRLERPGLTT